MKANEFFKAMGINAVRQFLENGNIRTKEMHDDLKRLVESHAMIEKVGGLDDAQHRLLHLALIDSHEEMKVLASAIADVESCMEVSNESN